MYVHKESDNSNNNDCATPDRCSAVFSCAACFVLDKVLFFACVCVRQVHIHTYMHMCVKESAQSRVGEAQLCHFVRDFHSVNEKGKAKVFSAAATKGGSFLFRLGV